MQTHKVKVIQAIDFLIGQSWTNLKYRGKKKLIYAVYIILSLPYTIDIPMENVRLLFD